MRQATTVLVGAVLMINVVSGCRKAPGNWQIVVDNKSGAGAEVSMDIGSGGGVNAPDIGAGEKRILLTGTTLLTVNTVKVVCSRKQQVFSPRTDVPIGHSFRVTIDAGGHASVELREL